jgi:hypothetical protein
MDRRQNAPADAASRWGAIISEARQHFSGQIWWAMALGTDSRPLPSNILSAIDGVYVLWDAPLAATDGASPSDLENEAGQLLDEAVLPLTAVMDGPIILAAAYPSADGVKTGCIDSGSGGCLDWRDLDQPQNPASVVINLQAQADMYDALLSAINPRAYVGGLVSRGYFPPTVLRDKSASIHGKPAADLLWYWFPRLTGAVP